MLAAATPDKEVRILVIFSGDSHQLEFFFFFFRLNKMLCVGNFNLGEYIGGVTNNARKLPNLIRSYLYILVAAAVYFM